VVRHPVIRPCAAMATAVNFVCGGVMALAPVYLVRTLHAPVGLVGLLLATEGVGTLAGAALTTRLAERLGSARLLLRATAVGGLFALLMPLAGRGPGLLLFAVGNAGFAAGVVVLSILARTHRQQTAPPELLPRVMATVRFLSWGVIPLGAVVAGLLGETLGVRAALGIVALLALATPLLGVGSAVRRRRDLA
jgi:MFS family permease